MAMQRTLLITVEYPEGWDEDEDITAIDSAVSNLEYDGFTVKTAKED